MPDMGFWLAAIVGPLAIFFYRKTNVGGYLWAGTGLLGLTVQPWYPRGFQFTLMVLFTLLILYGLSGIITDYTKERREEDKDKGKGKRDNGKKNSKS